MDEKTRVLMKNNDLITAKYDLSLVENRIFIIILYKLQKENNGSMTCHISQDEFKKLIGHKGSQSIPEIKSILENMMSSKVHFVEGKYNKKGNIWGQYNLLNGFKYDDELDTFKIECSTTVYDILMSYRNSNGYTPINLKVYIELKNPNSQRLYDLLRLWSNTKSLISYEIDEIRELFMLEDKYSKYSDLKKRVIAPAVNELNKTDMFDIDFTEKKSGKKVHSIDFTVKDKDKRKYFQTEIDTNIISEEVAITEDIKPTEEFYIPDKSVFTIGTLRAFKIDFEGYNFRDEYLLNAFNDSVNITLERDDKPKIYVAAYNFFKGTLKNKIDYYQNEKQDDARHQFEINTFWNAK